MVKEFSIRELIETLHVRRPLEAEAARLAAGWVPGEALGVIEDGIKALLAAADPCPQQDWYIDSQLHQALAHYNGNALLMQYIERLRLKTRMFNMRQVPERFIKGHQEHLAIIAALRAKDAEGAAYRRAGVSLKPSWSPGST